MRHARTAGASGRCIGRTPVPLSEAGREQVRQLVTSVGCIKFRRLCTSPAQRAVDTITPMALIHDLQVQTVPELNEIDMGAWDGLPFDEVRQKYPDRYAERGNQFAEFRPPNGESFSDVAARAMPMVERLAQGQRPVLAVTHAGVLRSILCRVTGHPLDDLFHFKPEYVRSVVFRWENDRLTLRAFNVAPDDLSSFVPPVR
nr:histidine phosphatase family protein [Pseudodesulfovibrio sp. JC047]